MVGVDLRRFSRSGVRTRRSVATLAAIAVLTFLVTPPSAVSGASATPKASTTLKRPTKKTLKRTTKTPEKPARTTVRFVPTQVAGVTITAPAPTTTVPPVPPTSTSPPPSAPTTSAPTTTVPPLAIAPFEVVAVNDRAEAVVGSTVAFSIVIAQRGASNPIALSLVGLPGGMAATLSPNPATGLAVLRIDVPSNAVPADYPLRVIGSFAGAQAWATMTLRVTSVAGSTTTSTIDPSGLAPSFGFRVTGDGRTLVTGGQVQYEIEPIYDTGYNGSIEYFVSGLPDGVWHGFSEKVSTKRTVLWLSSTVAMRPGRYPFTITGISKGLKKSGEVTLVIG